MALQEQNHRCESPQAWLTGEVLWGSRGRKGGRE